MASPQQKLHRSTQLAPLSPALTEYPRLIHSSAPDHSRLATAIIESSARSNAFVYDVFKRLLDISIATFALIVGSPLLVLIAVSIKLSSPGPILFSQERLGRRGVPFRCYKFRTMDVGAESLLMQHGELRKRFFENFKLEKDPRVTRFGRFLRSSSLDELPQFWNVLLGDLSLIGPRPIVPPELIKYGDLGDKLLSTKPGLSGMWQVCGRSDTTYSQRIELDMLYIDHHSFGLDVLLLWRTLGTVWHRCGAR